MIGDELLQLADRSLRLRCGRRKIFQLAQLCKLRHQLGKITDRAILFVLLVFPIRGSAAPLFFDLGGETCLLGLVKCFKFHWCHSCFQSLTGEGDEFSKLFPPQFQQFDLVFQRGRLVKIRII